MLVMQLRRGLGDLWRALLMFNTWSYLAYQDVGARYRRSLFGPLWIAAGTVAQALSMSIVFGAILRQPLADTLPYIMGGLIVFNFTGIPFNEGCETFVGAASTIRAYPLPFGFHIMRMLLRNLIAVAHSLFVFFVVVFLCRHIILISWEIIPGMTIAILFVYFGSIITAVVGLRFRDIRFLLPYLWQIVFFATPVFWRADIIPLHDRRRIIFEYNPFYYLIEVVRRPLLGEPVAPNVWPVSIAIIAVLAPISIFVFSRYRKQLALWI